jgi:aspartyl protease family protein
MLKMALGAAALAVVIALAAPDLVQRLVAAMEVANAPPQPAAGGGPVRVALAADRRGHFQVDLSVNGRAIEALIDTGASVLALTYDDGRALGLIRPGDKMDVKMQTANGVVNGKRVVLDAVRLGSISVSDVEGVVAPEGALPVNLLGMSFLKQLRSFEMSGNRLVLEQ